MTPTSPGILNASTRPGAPNWHAAGLILLCALASGCVTPWERSALIGGRDTTIDNVQGPTERGLRKLFWQREKDEYADGNGSLKPLEGTEDYLKAEELFEQEEYVSAQKAFHKVARKYKKSEIREDAVFMEAESAYNLGHYAKAQDKYSELLRDYPSTRHLDDVSKRLFEISRLWLDFPEVATVGQVQQVNYDDFGNKLPAPEPAEESSRTPMFWPNLTDKSRPLFDPEGNAVASLRLIWLNDPTGPLADDALMLAASHYARTGNFIEADRHYTLLREEYPNSPHVQDAFVLGSHVKLMSYEGPNYDGKSLLDAKHLKESTLRLYPNLEDRQRLESELAKIELEKAAREWELVVFYERKRNARGQAIYCHLILQRYPNSPYAEMARKRLKELGPEYAAGQKLLDPQPDVSPYRRTFGQNRAPLTNTPSELRNESAGSRSPSESAPPEDAPETKSPAPRRFIPWGGDDEPAAPEPESPGDQLAPPQEQTASASDAPTESSGGWSRMFRFTPPRRLLPSRDAKPIDDAAEKAQPPNGTATDSDESAGTARF